MNAGLAPPAHYRVQNDEVFYSELPIVAAGAEDLAFLKDRARRNPRLRSRLCTHPDPAADVHEMLIVHHRDVYVRPHRHVGRAESFHLIEGEALVVLFAPDGAIERVIAVGAGGERPFYYRMPAAVTHSFVIESEWLVFHETTSGPFDPSATTFAAWAPDGNEPASAAAYLADLRLRARAACA